MKNYKHIAFIDRNLLSKKPCVKDPNLSSNLEKECLHIAMKPHIYTTLKQNGYTVTNTLPYFTTESHRTAIIKSDTIIRWIREQLNNLFYNDNDITYAFKEAYIFWIRFAIHHCLWVIEIVKNAIQVHQPEVIWVSGPEQLQPSLSLYLQPEDGALRTLVGLATKSTSLSVRTFPVKKGILALKDAYCSKKTRQILKYLLNDLRFYIWQKKMIYKFRSNNRPLILFTTRFYQMQKLYERTIKEFQESEFEFLSGPYLPPFTSKFQIGNPTSFKKLNEIICKLKRLNIMILNNIDLFSYREVWFAKVVIHKLNDSIIDHILGLLIWSSKIDSFFDRLRPRCLVSNGNRTDDVVLAEICARKKIQVLMISHGSHTYPKNVYEHIEWGEHGRRFLSAPYSHLALQSPVSEGYLSCFPAIGKVAKTGPLIWGTAIDKEKSKTLFERMFNKKIENKDFKIVLHAGTPKPTNSLRFYVYETPDEYLRSIADLSEAIMDIKDTILLLRFRPTDELGARDILDVVEDNKKVVICTNEPFLDVLGMCDLLVSFSSTAIEEALQNKIPVLLYGYDGRYQHIEAQEIKKDLPLAPSAIYFTPNKSHLPYAIKSILSLGICNNRHHQYIFDRFIYKEKTSLEELFNAVLNA